MNPPTPPMWVFGTRMVFELTNAASLSVGKDYRPVSYLLYNHNRRGERKGVFAKALEMKDRVSIKRLAFDGDNWEVTAAVPSESDPNTIYTVSIYLPLDFECNCPYGQHRFGPCKHVFAVALKLLEIAGADTRDPILRHYVYKGLNKLAYHKAKTYRHLV
jgi:hypothetical protein